MPGPSRSLRRVDGVQGVSGHVERTAPFLVVAVVAALRDRASAPPTTPMKMPLIATSGW